MITDAEFDNPIDNDPWHGERPMWVSIPVNCDTCGKYLGVQTFDMTKDRPVIVCGTCE